VDAAHPGKADEMMLVLPPEIGRDDDGEFWPQWEMADLRSTTEEHYAKREREEHLKRAIHRLPPVLRNLI
jgi:hypothetical protein